MIINRISIKNFKMYNEERNFSFKPTTIIIGNNGVGKSTILEAINLALTGNYYGKPILKVLNQDIFNYEAVKKYLDSLSTDNKLEMPRIEISIYFDSYPEFKGEGSPEGSEYDGFTFYIEFDERYRSAYASMVSNNEIDSLPIEFYQIRWSTFDRREFYNSKFIKFKGLTIDSDNFNSNSIYTSRIIKEYFDEDATVKMSQLQRKIYDSIVDNETVNEVNERISSCPELQDKNFKLAISSISKTSWENLISARINEISFDNIGKGEQCVIKTYLSFANEHTKDKGIIMIEEPECHLSFSTLNKLLSFIKSKLCDFQVIITTHSSFVLNKLGLGNLLLISKNNSISFDDLDDDTIKFFEKRSGYDTLRFLLCDKSILVEGDSDELIVQKAYLDNYSHLPIEDGIDIITVGLSFLRFLKIAKSLGLETIVITDNDGNISALETKYKDYIPENNISVFYSKTINLYDDWGISTELVSNINTLEPELLRVNSKEDFNEILDVSFDDDSKLLHYMLNNKTECAWRIFQSDHKINYPKYILDAIGVQE